MSRAVLILHLKSKLLNKSIIWQIAGNTTFLCTLSHMPKDESG